MDAVTGPDDDPVDCPDCGHIDDDPIAAHGVNEENYVTPEDR